MSDTPDQQKCPERAGDSEAAGSAAASAELPVPGSVTIRFAMPASARATLVEPVVAEALVGETLLVAAERAGAEVGSHCGGVATCAACHVRVRAGAELLEEPSEQEEDGLDAAFDVRPGSRLACQARLRSAGRLELELELTEESRQAWRQEQGG